jgi:hypothetical protein
METDPNNIILNNIQTSNQNNITSDYTSHEVSLNEHQIQPEFDMLSKEKQLTSNVAAINLGQDNLFQNPSNVINYSNQIGENLTQNTLTTGGNQDSGAIAQTTGNVDNLDFLKATSEQYPTEEIPNINTPNIFTSKLLDETKKMSSSRIVNPTIFGDNNVTYSIGKTEEINSAPLTENLITTPGDLNLQQNQIFHSATTSNIDSSINNKDFSSVINPIKTSTENLGSQIKTSNIPAGKKLDLSDPKVIELMKKYPKVAELVKKYRTELVVEPKEEVKYIPIKRIRYVKKLKVYVPTIKKVYVPGKKIVIPKKKIVYVQRPKNVTSSQISSQIATSTNPVMMTSSYANPLATRTSSYNASDINKLTQSINSLNNSQMFGIQSINPSMSLVNPNLKSYNINTSTKVIEIPLSSSTSSTNILQSQSPIDLKTSTTKSFVLNNSTNPRIYSRSLPKNNLNII